MVTFDHFLKDNISATSLCPIACKIIAFNSIASKKNLTVITILMPFVCVCVCVYLHTGIFQTRIFLHSNRAAGQRETNFAASSPNTLFNFAPACDLQCPVQGQNVT